MHTYTHRDTQELKNWYHSGSTFFISGLCNHKIVGCISQTENFYLEIGQIMEIVCDALSFRFTSAVCRQKRCGVSKYFIKNLEKAYLLQD